MEAYFKNNSLHFFFLSPCLFIYFLSKTVLYCCHITITVVEEPGVTFSTCHRLKTSGIRSLKRAGRHLPREALNCAAASQKKKCWFALRFLSRVNPLCGLRYSKLTWTDVEDGKPEYCDSQATLNNLTITKVCDDTAKKVFF